MAAGFKLSVAGVLMPAGKSDFSVCLVFVMQTVNDGWYV